MTDTAKLISAEAYADADRSLQSAVRRFTERWTAGLGPREAAEFSADFVMVVQAVHREASRETHRLLMAAMASAPPATIIVPRADK